MDKYAGFWKRFLALIIDAIILGIANWIIIGPILVAVGISAGGGMFPFSNMGDMDAVDIGALIATITAMFGIAWVIQNVIQILYH